MRYGVSTGKILSDEPRRFKCAGALRPEQDAKTGLRNQRTGRKTAVVRVSSFRSDRLKSFPQSVSYASDEIAGGLLGGRIKTHNDEYEHNR